jgi:N-acetylmuramoyl-L-alanine amidase
MSTFHKSHLFFALGMVYLIFLVCGSLDAAFAQSREDLFNRARDSYRAALAIADKEQRVGALRKCIPQLQEVARGDSEGKVADRCYYLIGQCYHAVYDARQSRGDLRAAMDNYREVVNKFPRSPLADDAQYLIGELYSSEDPSEAYVEFAKVRLFFPKGDMRSKAQERSAQLARQLGCDKAKKKVQSVSSPAKEKKGDGAEPRSAPAPACPSLVRLEKIQHWSADDYTRVVLYTSGALIYKEHTIAADLKNKQPGKIYVDLVDCAVNPKMESRISIMDRFLQEVRAEQCEPALARVILDTMEIDSYRIFPLTDPARLVIDVRGSRRKTEAAAPKIDPDALKKAAPTLARQLALGVKRIVLDPGHGGKDKGAISPNKVYEKDIVLSIARHLKKDLEEKTGCEVILTRTKDRFISLEERTAIANSQKADLFISIHTNAHEDKQYHGIETYFLNLSKDKESARVAAFENATSTKKVSDLEAILHDLLLSTKINESARLAKEVQKCTVRTIKRDYESVRDLGTKQAPFYVLLGAEMPSILIETAFLTNAQEEKRLKDSAFQDKLAKGITAGIESYIQQMRGFAKKGDNP